MAPSGLRSALAAAAMPLLAAGCLTGQSRIHLEPEDVAECLREAGATVVPTAGGLAARAYEGALRARLGDAEVVLLFERNETEASANEEAARLAAIADGLSPVEADRVVGSHGNAAWYWVGRRDRASAEAVEACVRR